MGSVGRGAVRGVAVPIRHLHRLSSASFPGDASSFAAPEALSYTSPCTFPAPCIPRANADTDAISLPSLAPHLLRTECGQSSGRITSAEDVTGTSQSRTGLEAPGDRSRFLNLKPPYWRIFADSCTWGKAETSPVSAAWQDVTITAGHSPTPGWQSQGQLESKSALTALRRARPGSAAGDGWRTFLHFARPQYLDANTLSHPESRSGFPVTSTGVLMDFGRLEVHLGGHSAPDAVQWPPVLKTLFAMETDLAPLCHGLGSPVHDISNPGHDSSGTAMEASSVKRKRKKKMNKHKHRKLRRRDRGKK